MTKRNIRIILLICVVVIIATASYYIFFEPSTGFSGFGGGRFGGAGASGYW